jgi:signal transduction histidine kinase
MKNAKLRSLRIAVYGSASADPVAQWPSRLHLRSWDDLDGYDTVRRLDGQVVRIFFTSSDERKARLDWYRDEFSDEALPIIVILLGVTLPLSLITIRRGLAPVRRLAVEAEKIDPGEEHARLSESDVPLELLPLVKAVNHGLERLDAGLASQRHFSAIVAHELRTPLAILLMQLEREQKTPGIAEAKRQIQRLHRLVEQLLVISELSARRLKLDTVVDLTAVARETIGQEAPRALDDRVTIELEGPEQRFALRGNAAAIGAALRNLVNNAVRHSPAGGHVLVRLFPAEQAVEVSDEGSGVDAKARNDIFEPFWKKPDSKGAGVGLAIVREMAALHGGRVSLRDNAPHGSIFRIDFDGAGKSAFCSG